MNKNYLSRTLLMLLLTPLCVVTYRATGQESGSGNTLIYKSEDYRFQPQKKYSEEAGLKYNESSYKNHPEFGILPGDAPHAKNVVEDLSKRTPDERYYIDLDNPSAFYIQKSAVPINFEKDGWMVTINPKLSPSSTGIYEAVQQPYPTRLNTIGKTTSIKIGESTFSFNNYRLRATDMSGTISNYEADWTNIRVGNTGAYVTNVFPGIDMKISFREGEIKSDFIINEELPYKHLIFTDQLGFDESLYSLSDLGNVSKLFLIRNTDNTHIMEIGTVRSHDASGMKEHSQRHPYLINGNRLGFACDSLWLHNNATVYPVVIDPVFTAVGPLSGGQTGSLLAPSYCSNSISLTFPGGSMPWDLSAAWIVSSDICAYNFYDCWMSEALVRIVSSCGGLSPSADYWMCDPGCNSWGTWNPVLDFNNSGTQSLAQCYTPSCSGQPMTFSIQLGRTYCPSWSSFDACNYLDSYCQSLEAWQLIVQGRTVEVPDPTSITPSPCSGNVPLSAAPDYGVPGYTYLWNTGATSQSITATNAGNYSVVVTDACGTQATQQFTIACPLNIELADFNVVKAGENVLIKWRTSNEVNNDYFTVERKTDNSGKWEALDTVKGSKNSVESIHYKLYDNTPYRAGTSYYRLKQTDLNGESFYFEPKVIHFGSNDEIRIFPQPATNELSVEWNGFEGEIQLYSLLGEKMSLPRHKKGDSYVFDTSQLSSGIYSIVFLVEGETVSTQKVVIR